MITKKKKTINMNNFINYIKRFFKLEITFVVPLKKILPSLYICMQIKIILETYNFCKYPERANESAKYDINIKLNLISRSNFLPMLKGRKEVFVYLNFVLMEKHIKIF